MTAVKKIVKYLKTRKTGATAYEIAKYAEVNYNTARRILGQFAKWPIKQEPHRKCRVTGKMLTTYNI